MVFAILQEAEPFPTTMIAAATVIIATGSIAFTVYFFAKTKKTRRKAE